MKKKRVSPVSIPMSQEEKNKLKRLAAAAGMSMSHWVRDRVRRAKEES